MGEPAPLSAIQEFVLEMLRDREDAAVFGAQAVNAYVDEPRMSQDVDILSVHAEQLAEDIRAALNEAFQIAARVRSVPSGLGFRVYQVRKPKNRHLVDVRHVPELPPCQRIERILVPTAPELIAQKVISMVSRPNTAKGMTDVADLRRLLIAFPDLKSQNGPVKQSLLAKSVSEQTLHAWHEVVQQEIELDDDEY